MSAEDDAARRRAREVEARRARLATRRLGTGDRSPRN